MIEDETKFKLRPQTVELIAAYDERRRLFDQMRNLTLPDDVRKQLLADYAAAAKSFDKLRADAIK